MNAERFPSPPCKGWIAKRDPRLRILAALLFALVALSLTAPRAALCAFLLAAGAAVFAGLRIKHLFQRLLVFEGVMLTLLISLPFTVPGEVLLSMGPLSASREGLATAAVLVLKANTVVLMLLALVGSLEPALLGHALDRLGVPDKLTHLLLLTVSQIHLLDQELARLRRSMRARAFTPRGDLHTWRSYGHLIGMLLVRSLGRSRRLLAAMRCRGFQGRFHALDSIAWGPADTAATLLLAPLLCGLLLLDGLS
jgi:cobalt/nickel transport system permease protein